MCGGQSFRECPPFKARAGRPIYLPRLSVALNKGILLIALLLQYTNLATVKPQYTLGSLWHFFAQNRVFLEAEDFSR